VGDNLQLCSEDLFPFTLERYHKVADYLDIDPGIREKLAVVRVLQATKGRGIYP